MLPATLRNVEPKIAGQMLEVVEGQTSIHLKDQYLTEEMRGMIVKVPSLISVAPLFFVNPASCQKAQMSTSGQRILELYLLKPLILSKERGS
jgi:hypothetical protein